MFYKRFLFGEGNRAGQEPYTRVRNVDLYSQEMGYGFVTEVNRRQNELLRFPELNAAFDTVYWYAGEDMTEILEDASGCFLDSDGIVRKYQDREGNAKPGESQAGEPRRIPLCFKADVPEKGNYLVTLVIEAGEDMKEALVFGGRRRLMYRGSIAAGKSFSLSFALNVSDIIPRGQTKFYADRTIDISVISEKPRLTELVIQEISCPTLYIAGDSTVTDQNAAYPYSPGTSYAGWGQMLSAYLKSNIAVSNHSHSGLTTDSFREEGHYSEIEREGKKGDFILFQFGHNDQKLPELKAGERYYENLCRYVEESRARGMSPLLVTPLARNTWKGNDGSYNDLLSQYAEAVLEAGKELTVPVIDLHGQSRNWIVEQGLEAVKPYFFPGDFTHTNDYGAYRMAGIVAREMKRICADFNQDKGYRQLADCVADDSRVMANCAGGSAEAHDEWRADCEIVLPTKPVNCADAVDPDTAQDPLLAIDRLTEHANRADVLDMLIKTLHYFPINVYNDMFSDIVGHEWYAGTVECAWQNGMIDENLVEEGRFYPEREVTLEEFIVFAMNAYRGRRDFPGEEKCAYDDKCSPYAKPFVRAACRLGLIGKDGSEDLGRVLTRGEAVELCRKMQ